MSHRTQITLREDQYEQLKLIAEAEGVSMSELIRRAVDAKFGFERPLSEREAEERWQAMEQAFGLWKDRKFTGAEYVEAVRGSGLSDRLAKLGID